MARTIDAKLLRREMLTIMGLLDNLQAHWAESEPIISYLPELRKRLAKASIRNLRPSQACFRLPVDVRLPKAETYATCKILLELLADQPELFGINSIEKLREALLAIVRLLPTHKGKREMQNPTDREFGEFHRTTLWRRKIKRKNSASGILLSE